MNRIFALLSVIIFAVAMNAPVFADDDYGQNYNWRDQSGYGEKTNHAYTENTHRYYHQNTPGDWRNQRGNQPSGDQSRRYDHGGWDRRDQRQGWREQRQNWQHQNGNRNHHNKPEGYRHDWRVGQKDYGRNNDRRDQDDQDIQKHYRNR